MLEGVKYLLWDVDGTFYKYDPLLQKVIRQKIYEFVANGLGIPLKEARERYEKIYEKIGSATATSIELGLRRNSILEAIDSVDKSEYIKKDSRLLNMLEKTLKGYTHLIVTNDSRKGTFRTLEILDIPLNIFYRIITADDVINAKPNPEAFLKAIEITNSRPEECVSIGDRDKVDIIPAKRLGMKTIFVWGKSDIADYSFDTVYDVPKILLQKR